MDICANCGATIGALEEAFIFGDKPVCSPCNDRLARRAPTTPTLMTVGGKTYSIAHVTAVEPVMIPAETGLPAAGLGLSGLFFVGCLIAAFADTSTALVPGIISLAFAIWCWRLLASAKTRYGARLSLDSGQTDVVIADSEAEMLKFIAQLEQAIADRK